MSPKVLLVGAEAEQLASRLEISGYLPLRATQVPPAAPEAVILSPGSEGQIAELRLRWGAIPLLLGIDQDTVDNRCRTLNSGADDFWLSSLGPSDLLSRLRLHLNRGSGLAAETLLQVGDLQLCTAKRQVRRGLRILSLTSREYELLLLLLSHWGEVVSREQIRTQIWEDQATSASNVIEVYVRYLRHKLEAGGEARLLHTVRGLGYCLGPPGAAGLRP